jgi:hypothetical protein
MPTPAPLGAPIAMPALALLPLEVGWTKADEGARPGPPAAVGAMVALAEEDEEEEEGPAGGETRAQ